MTQVGCFNSITGILYSNVKIINFDIEDKLFIYFNKSSIM